MNSLGHFTVLQASSPPGAAAALWFCTRFLGVFGDLNYWPVSVFVASTGNQTSKLTASLKEPGWQSGCESNRGDLEIIGSYYSVQCFDSKSSLRKWGWEILLLDVFPPLLTIYRSIHRSQKTFCESNPDTCDTSPTSHNEFSVFQKGIFHECSLTYIFMRGISVFSVNTDMVICRWNDICAPLLKPFFFSASRFRPVFTW